MKEGLLLRHVQGYGLSASEKYFSVYFNRSKDSIFSHGAPKPEEGKPYNA